MTPAQMVILDEEQAAAYRRAQRNAKDGPVEPGTMGDLASMLGGLG